MASTFQPFVISEFKTGLFNYLEPWIRPNEAFDPLDNAFIYRGTLNKRSGYTIFGSTGVLIYKSSQTLAIGNAGVNYNSNISGVIANFPIIPGSISVIALTAGGLETFTDNGIGPIGTLTGSLGGVGAVIYASGVWNINMGAAVNAPQPIIATYKYTPTALSTPVYEPIMGIKTYIDETTNVQSLVVCDTKRACVFNTVTNVFDPLSSISQTLWIDDGSTASIVLNTGWTNLVPYSVTVSYPSNSMTDDGIGGFPGAGVMLNTSTVNYTTGVITLNLSANSAGRVFTITANLTGDYFTGNNTNFFNSTNWLGNLYLTNNKDRITLFNGTTLSRPPFPITQAHQVTFTNDINTCLDVKVYKNRLLALRPVIVPSSSPSGQSIRYSALNNPTNMVADVSGNGGELSAPSSDWIQASQFLRDTLIVFFQNTTWTFRFTGSAFDPFRFDKINNSKSTNAPYASIDYDERSTSAGAKGLIACDGVNVQRYDLQIIDQFEDIYQVKFGQCFSQRFDTNNQSWMLYPSVENKALVSDKVLVYNFVENSWSTYSLPLSCLGIFQSTSDKTWSSFSPGSAEPNKWNQMEFGWNYYILQSLSPVLLGGSHHGAVYLMNYGDQDAATTGDGGTQNITTSITSTRWNPFIGTGQRVQFGYIDFYYDINPDVVLELSFYVNNSTNTATTRTLTLDGPADSDVAWKRVYVNLVGEFLRMNIYSESPGYFKINGMILWATPSGRLTAP